MALNRSGTTTSLSSLRSPLLPIHQYNYSSFLPIQLPLPPQPLKFLFLLFPYFITITFTNAITFTNVAITFTNMAIITITATILSFFHFLILPLIAIISSITATITITITSLNLFYPLQLPLLPLQLLLFFPIRSFNLTFPLLPTDFFYFGLGKLIYWVILIATILFYF
jgi:hypothetical protein